MTLFTKYLMVLFICISGINKATAQSVTISGRITQTSDYCGGAYLKELIDEARRPKPYPNKTIYFKPGSSNSSKQKIVASAKSDSLGNFTVQLLPGNYCVIEESKTKKLTVPPNNQNSTYDTACLKQQWQKCDYSLDVTKSRNDMVVINFHRHCPYTQPCTSYHGPMPPGAPRK